MCGCCLGLPSQLWATSCATPWPPSSLSPSYDRLLADFELGDRDDFAVTMLAKLVIEIVRTGERKSRTDTAGGARSASKERRLATPPTTSGPTSRRR
jgi:hypothetical protein